jgi:sugar lactone lactonase YvrE
VPGAAEFQRKVARREREGKPIARLADSRCSRPQLHHSDPTVSCVPPPDNRRRPNDAPANGVSPMARLTDEIFKPNGLCFSPDYAILFHVCAPDGTRIGQVLMPEGTANLRFVGKHRNRLFMTSSQSVYTLYTAAQGAQMA